MADKYVNATSGLAAIRDWIKSKANTFLSFASSGRKATFRNSNASGETVDIQNINSDKSSIYILANGLQTTNYLPTETAVDNKLADKQDTLVSGTNIKTVNNTSLLGSGNINIEGGGGDSWFLAKRNVTTFDEIVDAIADNRPIIVQDGDYPQYGGLVPMLDVDFDGDTTYSLFTKIGAYRVKNDDTWTLDIQYGLADRTDLSTQVGDRQTLMTDNKSNLVNAVNEVYTKSSALATETAAGNVKLNPNQNITLNSNGQLEVGGRMGQFSGTTGIFAPNDREPRNVNNYSMLLTDAKGMDMSTNRAFAVVSGYGLTCQSASAGSTVYRISNTYANRIIAKCCEGGYASRDEATSTQEQIVSVTSVRINGSTFNPDSAADDSSKPIEITVSSTLNPDSAITSIRLFGKMGSYATAYIGNGITGNSGGRNLLIGGGVTKAGSGNDNCIVGNGMYSSGNGNAMFGRYHIARKNRGFFAGTGHDSTNAPNEGASAVGQYSFMDSNTLFAVGNGSSHTNRKNAFEVRSDGIVLRSPNGTRYKLVVDDSGNITTTAL